MWTVKEYFCVGNVVRAYHDYKPSVNGTVVNFRIIGSFGGKGYYEITIERDDGIKFNAYQNR